MASRTRGHVIVEKDGKFTKYYLAYNANPDWMLNVLPLNPVLAIERLSWCTAGISQYDENGVPHAYHDYTNMDTLAHPNAVYDKLEDALASCVLENIYIWDGITWSHKVLENVVTPERLVEIRPLKRKKNVWRDMRKAHEAKTAEEVEDSQPE